MKPIRESDDERWLEFVSLAKESIRQGQVLALYREDDEAMTLVVCAADGSFEGVIAGLVTAWEIHSGAKHGDALKWAVVDDIAKVLKVSKTAVNLSKMSVIRTSTDE
jgi:hypothetical protein